jgi:rhodanese-related sulfurtransferase
MTLPSCPAVSPQQLKHWIHDGQELALLDIREHGQFGEDHLFFAVPLPYSQLETDLPRLVPRRSVRAVLYADQHSTGALHAAVRAMQALGYTQCHVLDGGIDAWKAAGYATFAGVNLPSKTFGELAEHAYNTPRVSAQQLHEMMQNPDADLVVLDGRPIEEYHKMSIPGALCCPNGELALRIHQIAPSPDTTIVINCAGRTRSIIGAQTLINLQIPNPVFALENGTQGWYLADLALEHGADRVFPSSISAHTLQAARQRAAVVQQRHGIETVRADQVAAWLAQGERSVFLCDIRTREEFEREHLPALVQHAPGGQLIQATDQYVGVRNAQVVLCDFDGVRAPVVASWLKQLGWSVVLLADVHGLAALADTAVNPGTLLNSTTASAAGAQAPVLHHTQPASATQAWQVAQGHAGVLLVDVRPSMQYRKGHVKGAVWSIRPALHTVVPDHHTSVVLFGSHPKRLAWLAHDLEQRGVTDIHLCTASLDALKTAGFTLQSTPDTPADAQCIDYLFFVHDRHDGNKEAARQYLQWETNLVAQLDEAEMASFALPGQ